MKKSIIFILIVTFMISCAEEVLTTAPQSTTDLIATQVTTDLASCAQSQLDKPPVDILYVLDNSGSSLSSDFESIKAGIAATINDVSTEFDYHIYIAPLIASPTASISSYPVIANNTSGLSGVNIRSIDSLTSNDFFPPAIGNNVEAGFSRAYNLVQNNRANGIFRSNAHTIIVMVSNGDDTTSCTFINGNVVCNDTAFNSRKNELLSFKQPPMNAETLRFISVVPKTSSCKVGFRRGTHYIRMSQQIYKTLDPAFKTDPNQDVKDLCSNDVSSLFSSVNSTIRSVVTGHKYDHWLISNATDGSQIQEDDITLTKVSSNGAQTSIPRSSTNGFEYLGYQSNINTRFAPTEGAAVSGLVVKLNGSAKVSYPDCIIAQTKTPVEYYGWTTIPREPNVSTITVKINGVEISQSTENGWSYSGYFDSQNIKISHNGASNQPGVYQSGYFIKLNGTAIMTNGDSIEVFYTAAAID